MMRQDEELWMKKMKEALRDYAEPPAPDGWSRLEKELTPVAPKRIRPYTQWVAIAAALLIAVSGISLFFMQSPSADDVRHTAPPVLTSTPNAVPVLQEPDRLISQVEETKTTTDVTQRTSLFGNKPKKESITSKIIDVTEEPLDIPVVTKEISNDMLAQSDERSKEKVETPSEERRVVKPSSKDKLHIPVTTKRDRAAKGKWSVGASVSNMPSTTSSENHDYLLVLSNPSNMNFGDAVSDMVVIENENDLVFQDGLPYLKQRYSVNEMKHKQPISVGFSVRKGLGNGFSIESGVMYTLLSSDGKMENNPSEKIEQKLHYIGIPVRGNWDFVEIKRFTAYVSAGAMVEKCVYGKIGSEKHTIDELQFSVSSGVGAQVNVSNRVGLYIEPGISYFFDDGSKVETIRKDNKVNFNLQAGIRFTY